MMFKTVRLVMLSYSWIMRLEKPMIVLRPVICSAMDMSSLASLLVASPMISNWRSSAEGVREDVDSCERPPVRPGHPLRGGGFETRPYSRALRS